MIEDGPSRRQGFVIASLWIGRRNWGFFFLYRQIIHSEIILPMRDTVKMQSSVTLNSTSENTSIYSKKDYILQSAYRKKDRVYLPAQSTSANKLRVRLRQSQETTRHFVVVLISACNLSSLFDQILG